MSRLNSLLIKIILWLVIGWVGIMLLALRLGFFDVFSYSSFNYHNQGIDFFSLPKAFLNLLEHRSMYDSWGGNAYGPYSTWFIAHPAFGLVVGFWFSLFSPWTSYWLFVILSLVLLGLSAHVLAADTADQSRKNIIYLLIFCSFPTYWVLYTGNIQAFSVLSFALILSALFLLAYREDAVSIRTANSQLLAGLLLSFFSKPFALLFLPVLLANRETRRITGFCLAVYFLVSILFIIAPPLNPEKLSAGQTLRVALSPQFAKEHLNVYRNNFVLNEYMKDNSIHWLNLVAQSDHYWNHIDIFALSAFINTLAGKTLPGIIYKLPLLLALSGAGLICLARDRRRRLLLSLSLIMATSLTFFLSYNTVWEYQYTLFLPAAALLLLLQEKEAVFQKWFLALLALASFLSLPTLYFLVRWRPVDSLTLTVIRADKVVPALLLYLCLIALAAAAALPARSNPS
jgi:hypothetical protein